MTEATAEIPMQEGRVVLLNGQAFSMQVPANPVFLANALKVIQTDGFLHLSGIAIPWAAVAYIAYGSVLTQLAAGMTEIGGPLLAGTGRPN